MVRKDKHPSSARCGTPGSTLRGNPCGTAVSAVEHFGCPAPSRGRGLTVESSPARRRCHSRCHSRHHRFGSCPRYVMLVCVLGLAVAACNQTQSKDWHGENVDRWNEFWGIEDSGGHGSLFGRRAGETEVWTIECNAYRGHARQEMADKMATVLKRVRQLRSEKVWVEHDEKQSRVYYGDYELKYVEAQVDRESHAKGDFVIELNEAIKRDLRFIKTLAIGEKHPFFSARTIPKPIKDVGPPEWDLRNAKGVYTLHVGVTYNTQALHNYKQAAVEWVRALREDGHEAYYYHDPDKPRSDVCVGTFDDDALVESADDKTQYSEAVNALRGQSDFKYNLENGLRVHNRAKNTDTGQVERIPNWSFLVKIPQGDSEDDEW